MKSDNTDNENRFSREVGEKEKRRLRALHENKHSVWGGLGLFGMVGWSVVVPMLLGAACGSWLDKRRPEPFSWTLTLLIAGLMAGCLIAWNWVDKENKKIHKKEDPNNE